MQLISLIYGFLGFPLATQIVIQSEAKDLVYTDFMFSRFFAPLCFALNDNMVEILLLTHPLPPL